MAETRLPQTPGERLSSLTIAEQLARITTGYIPDPQQELQETTYYDYPVLQEPAWHWEIYWYFFCGGLAAGCYVIASLAALFSSPEDRVVTRAGYYLSLLAFLPCPPLLIKDLGRPERFLHMLRIVKVRSPMSMGTWAVVCFSLFSGLAATMQAARDGILGRWFAPRLLAALPQALLALPGSLAGFFLASYTGVLLAATSIPLWSRSKMLGAIFLTSAMSTSAALITLVLYSVRAPASALEKLDRFEWVVMVAEMLELLAFLRTSGRAARPLVGTGPGEGGREFWGLVCGSGLALPWLLKTIGLLRRGSHSSRAGVLPALLVLLGGFFLRRTIVLAGHTSSRDARTTLWNARRLKHQQEEE